MALTQQIARLTAAQLADCRASIDALGSLCAFTLRGVDDYLDLDWSPTPLQRAAVASGLPNELIEALSRACAGSDEINPGYRNVAVTIWEHPVTALDPAAMRDVAGQLDAWSASDIVQGLAHDAPTLAKQLQLTELPEQPRTYVSEYYEALRGFNLEAAQRELATAMWWD